MDISSLKLIVDRVKAGRFSRLEARVGEARFGFTVVRPPAHAAAPPPAAAADPGAPPSPGDGLLVVKAHLVGRFYTTATAGDGPPLKAGARVKKGQRIGMIEAMNIEHVITAGCDATLVETLLDDGEPAEYGRPLFRLRPARPGGGA